MIYQPTDMFHRPNPECDEEQENPAEDYVILSEVGIDSECREQCGYCDEWYAARRLANGTIRIERD